MHYGWHSSNTDTEDGWSCSRLWLQMYSTELFQTMQKFVLLSPIEPLLLTLSMHQGSGVLLRSAYGPNSDTHRVY